MTVQSPVDLAGPPARRHGSRWSTPAVVAALVVWVAGVLLHVLGALGPVVAVSGVVAGVLAYVREERTGWRVVAAVAGLASLAALSIYLLVMTSAVSWPPSRW
jgi:hypothetical protein